MVPAMRGLCSGDRTRERATNLQSGTGCSGEFEPVIWGPNPHKIRELSLLKGDTVGAAMAINDNGQAVGVTGTCSNTEIPPFTAAPHAVLWEKDGTVHNLGNLAADDADSEASEADEGVVRPAIVLSQCAREQLQQRLPFGPLGAQLMAH